MPYDTITSFFDLSNTIENYVAPPTPPPICQYAFYQGPVICDGSSVLPGAPHGTNSENLNLLFLPQSSEIYAYDDFSMIPYNVLDPDLTKLTIYSNNRPFNITQFWGDLQKELQKLEKLNLFFKTDVPSIPENLPQALTVQIKNF